MDLNMVPRPRVRKGQKSSVNGLESLVLSLVDGKRDVAALGNACGLEPDMTQRIVIRLMQEGLLEGEGEAGETEKNDEHASASPVVTPSSETDAAGLDALYEGLNDRNYYEILGVSPVADRKDIRRAYFSLSRAVHPDSASKNEDGETRRKRSRVFQAVTMAYEVLSSRTRRQKYDASIAQDIEMWEMSVKLKQAVAHKETGASVASSAKKRNLQHDVSVSERAGGRAAARISRIPVMRTSVIPEPLPTKSSVPSASKSVSSTPPEEIANRREQWKRNRLSKALESASGSRPPGRRTSRSPAEKSTDELSLQADIALEQQEYPVAQRILAELVSRDPKNKRWCRMRDAAEKGMARIRALDLMRVGRAAAQAGDSDGALGAYEKALVADQTNLEVKYLVAQLLLDKRYNLPRAYDLVKEILGAGGKKAKYFALMSDLLVLSRERARAADAMSRAVKLEPNNGDYKKRLKALSR